MSCYKSCKIQLEREVKSELTYIVYSAVMAMFEEFVKPMFGVHLSSWGGARSHQHFIRIGSLEFQPSMGSSLGIYVGLTMVVGLIKAQDSFMSLQ